MFIPSVYTEQPARKTTGGKTATRPSFQPVHFDAGKAERTARETTGAEKSTWIPDHQNSEAATRIFQDVGKKVIRFTNSYP